MTKAIRFADGAGVVGAVFAALCCAGLPLIVSVLASVGLSFLRTDAILLPLMALSLAVALWGFWDGCRMHGRQDPSCSRSAGVWRSSPGLSSSTDFRPSRSSASELSP